MKKLTGGNYREAMDYILKEPEFNLFIIGDLENYGLDGPDVSAYTSDSWHGGMFPFFLLDYRKNYVFYSHDEKFPAEEAAEFLSGCSMKNLSGKKELIERLLSHLKGLEIVPNYLARLDSLSSEARPASNARKLGEKDIPSICNLLYQIDEFFTIKEKTPEENQEDIRSSITNGGRMYGIFEGDILVSVAGTAAENSMSAMVVSVGTLPGYREKGYASALVARLCKDCLEEGMKFLCLFYNNPEAGHIYRKLGFSELGQYAMVRSIHANAS
ncbi:GNAT family N-acetyltransferase [Clostridium sp. Marseille-P2415]|uniref:GNAT family N-acetyltransferase n=1 Tax=Clostridium sp. Marseille-P2415 TaxID=1805471 RepID=UPI0009883A4E|nr:GNAT family N-acetyltransferase [Clostridium sp. Marseille-P2415]